MNRTTETDSSPYFLKRLALDKFTVKLQDCKVILFPLFFLQEGILDRAYCKRQFRFRRSRRE